MYSRTDFFAIAKAFGASLTGQTLRNYTKAGLCSGADGSKSGLARQGTFAIYQYESIIEAIVSRIMLTKKSRKLVVKSIAFGRYIFQIILSDPSFIFDSAHVMPHLETFFPNSVYKTVDDYGPKRSTISVRVSPNEVYSLQKIMDIASEWCYKYAILLTTSISMEDIVSINKSNEIINVNWNLIVEVDADKMYFLQSAPPVGNKVVINPHLKKVLRINA